MFTCNNLAETTKYLDSIVDTDERKTIKSYINVVKIARICLACTAAIFVLFIMNTW